MFKKYVLFLIVSLFSVFLVVYKKAVYENVDVGYYERGNTGKRSSTSSDSDGDRCSGSDKICAVDYSDESEESHSFNVISYDDRRINRVKKRVSDVFEPFFSEMKNETKDKHIISLFLEFVENGKLFIIISMRSSFHMLHAYGIVLISLLKILFLWFLIIEPYLQWLYFKCKILYTNLDYKMKKYIMGMVSIFTVFLYLLYTGIITYILNKISKCYKYMLKKVFRINNFLFKLFPYILSSLLYFTLVKTVPISFISFFIYSFFFPLPSVYSVIIMLKYVYIPNINDCVINTLVQNEDYEGVETIKGYPMVNDYEYAQVELSEEMMHMKSGKKGKELEGARRRRGGTNQLEGEQQFGETQMEEVKEEKQTNGKKGADVLIKEKGADVLIKEKGADVLIKEKGADVSGKEKEVNVSGKEKEVNASGKEKEVNVSGKEKEVNVSGKEKEVNVSGDEKEATVEGEEKQTNRANNENTQSEKKLKEENSMKKKLPFFNMDKFGFNSKKKKKEENRENNKTTETDCEERKEYNYESLNVSKIEEVDGNSMHYDVPILLEYWLFINILKFLNFFFFFRKYSTASFTFEYFTLFVICINISEKLHEFVFLKRYKSSILVRFLKNIIVSTVDFVLYSLFNIRIENEEKKKGEGNNAHTDMKYIERSNLLIKLTKVIKEKLKLNETVRFSLTCIKSVITENVVESIKLPFYIKIFINILIYMPQLILLIFPSFILKIYFAYFFFIFPIFGSLKCLEEKSEIHNKIYFICYFFFYNIASVTVNHAFFKCLPFHNLYKILITISVQTVLKYIFNALKVKN
ncbi:conserved Plasmodium protein, unknown function [Plasmodium ovale]|uniref:Uncharacterized protein n=1 Tax=Plasmodium ovale TaxID=36330 RepID=A0A1C3L568_PLAOA|nr:conserved Plasmodium protein, unknown function [Plasmodium ovale]